MKRKLPAFKTDEEAARFLDREDLSDYINVENMVPAHFEFERKTKNLTMRMPAALLEAVKARAARQGIPYQRFIRQTLERVLTDGPLARRR
jgi:predicted DNA binding CopG/RHH family protein